MTVLITGAGMIGCQAAQQLVQRGERVVLFDVAPRMDNIASIADPGRIKVVRGDVLAPLELVAALRAEKVDTIIHTVAVYGMTRAMAEAPYPGYHLNILGTLNILEAARLHGVRRVVFTSSGMVYFRHTALPPGAVPEDLTARGVEDRPATSYGTSKLACELIGLNYCDNHGVDFMAVRFSSVFGPWRGPVSGGGGLVVKEVLQLTRAGKVIPLGKYQAWHSPTEQVYSRDAARSLVLACFAAQPKSRVYNISMGKQYTLSQILEILGKLGLKVVTEGKAEAGPPSRPPLDLSRARQELGYVPEYDMESALRDYLAWMEAHPEPVGG